MLKNISILYEEYLSVSELSEEDQDLMKHAKDSAELAYAPYSNFHVGAALLLDDGTVITGNNQENAAFPSGLCAERVALFSALSVFPDKKIKMIAITAFSDEIAVNTPVTPCGSCRQVIAETEKRQSEKIRVLMAGKTGKVIVTEGIDCLLPFAFNPEKLKG